MTINISKNTTTITMIGKSSGASLIWNNATNTWDNETGTWNDAGQIIANISKNTVTIAKINKS